MVCSSTIVDKLKDEGFQFKFKTLKMTPEDISGDRSCGSKMIARMRLRRCCKHILRIPRVGEAVTKSRSGPMTCQDTSITHQMWPGTVLRKGNGKCLWRPERPGLRNETKRCAQKKSSAPWALEGGESAAPWELSEELGEGDSDWEECPRCSEQVPRKWGKCNVCGAHMLG